MRRRSRFLVAMKDWPQFLKIKSSIPELKNHLCGNYCFWTENVGERDKLEKYLQKACIPYRIDWEYEVAESSDLERFKKGDRIEFRVETLIGTTSEPWKGIILKTSPLDLEVYAKPVQGRKRFKIYRVDKNSIRAIRRR